MEKMTVEKVRAGLSGQTNPVWVRKSALTEQCDAVYMVHGNGMAPMIRDGDMVMISFEDQLEPGAIGMFLVNGRTVLRQYYPDGLRAFRPELTSFDVPKAASYEVIGRFLAVITEDMLPTVKERAAFEEATSTAQQQYVTELH